MAWWASGYILGVTGCLVAATCLWRHRRRRTHHLSRLASRRPELMRETCIQISATNVDVPANEFARQHITRIGDFVTPECLNILRDEAESQIPLMKRTYIPTHKKGATLSYEQIHTLAPHCLAFYHHPDVQRWVSAITGVPVQPTPDQDQSSLSILCYSEPGDHINWHYDHNFYRGRHFTVLLSLVNEGPKGGSSGTLQRQLSGGRIQDFDTRPNSLIIFEGARVRHRASAVAPGERRIILSMTYCADPRISRFKEVIRRGKDTAFFGLRALWD